MANQETGSLGLMLQLTGSLVKKMSVLFAMGINTQ
jgi:hypothetical protein